MNCLEFEDIVVDIARGEPLAPQLKGMSDAHLALCQRCRGALAEQQRISAALREIAVEARALHAPAALESSLRAWFRDRHARASAPTRLRRHAWRQAVAGLGALLAVLLGLQGTQELSRAQRDSRAAAPTSGPTVTGRREAAPAYTSQGSAGEPRVAFVPLLYSADPWTAGAGPVVRMRVPAGVLGTLGYAVSPAEAQTRVTADVWLGEDGVARAIRFVSFESSEKE
jgi:hypothetical protein